MKLTVKLTHLRILVLMHSTVIFSSTPQHYQIGLCMMATGKYISYAKACVESAKKYFCTNHNITYFVFTDSQEQLNDPQIVQIFQKRLGWPYDTMMRFEVYFKNQDQMKNMDYIFALDADMLFVAPVEDEILTTRVATQHPGFVNQRGTYETKAISKACVKPNEGKYYFAGGFYGGSHDEFFKLLKICNQNIYDDLSQNYIAIWHDESHLNRYFIDNPPTKILSPSYCYPENWNLPYQKKLLALDKNHAKMRE